MGLELEMGLCLGLGVGLRLKLEQGQRGGAGLELPDNALKAISQISLGKGWKAIPQHFSGSAPPGVRKLCKTSCDTFPPQFPGKTSAQLLSIVCSGSR